MFVYAKTLDELIRRLKDVFIRLGNAGLKVKKEKCLFGVQEVEFLGFIVNKDGIKPSKKRCEDIHNFPESKNKKELQQFMGLLNFYSSFLKNKANIAEPLHRLLDNDKPCLWSNVHKVAFKDIKELLSSDSLLVHFDMNKPIILVCDASPDGVGAVLCHRLGNPNCSEEC